MPRGSLGHFLNAHQRADHRFSYNGRAVLKAKSLPGQHVGSIVDLSAGGCLLQFQAPLDLEIGAVIDVNLHSRYLALDSRGAICHLRDGNLLIGIAFQSLSYPERSNLRDLIADLATSTRLEPCLI